MKPIKEEEATFINLTSIKGKSLSQQDSLGQKLHFDRAFFLGPISLSESYSLSSTLIDSHQYEVDNIATTGGLRSVSCNGFQAGGNNKMPIHSQWLTFDFSTVKKEQDSPGVYELGDSFGNVVYIGGSRSLRSRLLAHLKEPISSYIRSNANSYRTECDVDPTIRLGELYEEHLALHGTPPVCNELTK